MVAWFVLIELIQTKAQSLIGGECDLSTPLLNASQLFVFLQPVDHDALEVTPRVQLILPVIKHRKRGHDEEHLNQILRKQISTIPDKMFYVSQQLTTYFVGFSLIGWHLTLQKLRPVFLYILPCACFVQHCSKETNDLDKITRGKTM